MRPTQILHEFVQNLQIVKFQIEFTIIGKIAFAVSRTVFLFKTLGKYIKNPLTIVCPTFSFLLFFNYATSDVPICGQHYITDGSIRLSPSAINYSFYIANKFLCYRGYFVFSCHR